MTTRVGHPQLMTIARLVARPFAGRADCARSAVSLVSPHGADHRHPAGRRHLPRPDASGADHRVSVPAGFPACLGCGHVEAGELVRASSSSFLNASPPPRSLREFSLDVISRYFPGYRAEIRARLRSSDPGTHSGRPWLPRTTAGRL